MSIRAMLPGTDIIMPNAARPALVIRDADSGDAEEIAILFFETVRRVNSRDYEPSQITAWAGTGVEVARWEERIAKVPTFIAMIGDQIVGFAGFEPDGHIDTLFVHHAHQGEGIASRLLDHIEAEAGRLNLGRLHTEASITARPLFERRGFVVVAEQEVERQGVRLTNYRMERILEAQ